MSLAVDGNALLIDDDGTGYIAYATIQAGGNRSGDHMVTIDRLAPDLLSSTRQVRPSLNTLISPPLSPVVATRVLLIEQAWVCAGLITTQRDGLEKGSPD